MDESVEDKLYEQAAEQCPPSYATVEDAFESKRVLTDEEKKRTAPKLTLFQKLFLRWRCQSYSVWDCIHSSHFMNRRLTIRGVEWTAQDGWRCKECKKPAEMKWWWPTAKQFTGGIFVPAAALLGWFLGDKILGEPTEILLAKFAGAFLCSMITLVIVVIWGPEE